VSKAPDWHHQYTCTRIVWALENWNDQTGAGVTLPAPGLVFAADQDVIPDVVWVSHERLAAISDGAGHFRRAPELVIEVLSAGAENEKRDRETKLKLYSRQGFESTGSSIGGRARSRSFGASRRPSRWPKPSKAMTS
jgi:Uma2 family endonuclease